MDESSAARNPLGRFGTVMSFLAAASTALNEAGARSVLPPPPAGASCGLAHSEAGWTAQRVEEWAAAFRQEAAGKSGHPRLLDPLPRRVRLRLWLNHRIDRMAIRLLGGGHERAAIALWRVTGHW